MFAIVLSGPARADTVTVQVDQAKLLKLPNGVATVVIGNPQIADVTLQSGGVLVVTGKGYGATNLLALDQHGRVIQSDSLQVVGPSGHDLVVVYTGANRTTYSCTAQCQPRTVLGDSIYTPKGAVTPRGRSYFDRTAQQTADRNGLVQGKGAK
ncbi:MAG: pilus assembly protein N-terminal domain-containing protein [Pseudolabrys sp.]